MKAQQGIQEWNASGPESTSKYIKAVPRSKRRTQAEATPSLGRTSARTGGGKFQNIGLDGDSPAIR